MQTFGITISNGTTILENAYNDQMYLKDTINNLKKSVRPRLPGKIDEKELTLKNVNELLAGRKWDINSFESGICPMRTVNLLIWMIIIIFLIMNYVPKEL